MPTKFFNLYKKQATERVLRILQETGLQGIPETDFFKRIEKELAHLNEFYRIKASFIQYDFIEYRLNDEYEKYIVITDNGLKLLKKLDDIHTLLADDIKIVNNR